MRLENKKHVIIFFIILPFLVIRIYYLQNWLYDDAITYLAATGHQIEYHENPPIGKWVLVSDWQRFWTTEDKLCFRTISRGLVKYDIHPPLYFWLLHAWILIWAKTNLITGPLLNLLIFFLSFLALKKLCNTLSIKEPITTFILIFWAASPATVEPLIHVRQYMLFTLVSICFHIMFINFFKEKTTKNALFLIIFTTLGLLTHYHFFLLVGSILLFSIISAFLNNKKGELKYILLCISLAVLFFFLLHPNFYQSFLNQTSQWEIMNSSLKVIRAYNIVLASLKFLFPRNISIPVALWASGNFDKLLLFTLIIFLTLTIILFVKSKKARISLSFRSSYILFNLLFLTIVVTILYMLSFTPIYGMTPKYICYFYPLISILFGIILMSLFKHKKLLVILIIICFHQLYYLAYDTRFFIASRIDEKRELNIIKNANQVLMDGCHRGILPRVFYNLNPLQNVWVSSQADIISNFEILNEKFNNKFLYISNISAKNHTITMEKKIIYLLNELNFCVSDTNIILNGHCKVYSVTQKN